VVKIAHGLNGKAQQREFVLPIESWTFDFFSIFVFAHGFA
jgi:hypothetical protein